MKKVTIIALFAAIGLVSCKDTNAEPAATETTETTTSTPETTPATTATGHEGHDHGTDLGSSAAQGTNPPHGQPGHRCDIPVGAPLNSPPAQPRQQAAPANQGGFLGGGNPQAPAQQQARPVQQTAPGMQGKPNPAHGQPGHRCDIAVGQPLP